MNCLDTYALVEIAKGHPAFVGYFSEEFVIANLTLIEFYAVLLREDGEKTAEYWFERLKPYAITVNQGVMKEAIEFRHQHRRQRISFFDAVGYIFSLKNNYRFVTGDKEFKNLKGVEYQQK